MKTIPHSDAVGVVTRGARRAGGFRLYTAEDVTRLLVIRRMKPLGFTLAEMKELLDALDTLADPESGREQRALATGTVHELRAKAEDSCAKLRRQLAYAEEFTELLSARIEQ
ncbi:MerR family DNA-binding protein [Nocardia cyriacigeorgica]|uniref:MerR family DNA-binding protein n=1 Tax=Nocardia cyriacigeorgica TaxID=135487 RepID=UPI002455ABE1|nr:MerR family DNA-binding protein [Nocardia cyriacigeorgica]